MNKAQLLEALHKLEDSESPNWHSPDYYQGLSDAIELVEQLTCITDPTFPADIREPVPLRDYGVLYLVMDASNDRYHITRQDMILNSFWRHENALKSWHKTVNEYYPETRETE